MTAFKVGLIPVFYDGVPRESYDSYILDYDKKIIIDSFYKTSILSSYSAGYLYSATRSSSMLTSPTTYNKKLAGFMFVIGFGKNTDTTNIITLSQIKL
jgi:hypothetical protein